MPEKSSGAVSRMAPTTISRVSFGVRYEPQFRVLDHIGELVDIALRSTGTPFGPEVFPHTQTNHYEHTLTHPERQDLLRISQQDTILIMGTDSRNLEDVLKLAEAFQTFVLAPLRKIAGVRQIIRYGIVVRLTSPANTLQKPPIQRYLAQDFSSASVTSLTMRFVRRLPSMEAMVKKGVEDYRQVIHTVEESEKGQVQVTFDYQEYFKPMLDASDWEKRPFAKFAEQGTNYFDGEFKSWFKTFVGVPEVA